MSNSKNQIDKLKQQLASMDVSFKDLSKTMMSQSPSKIKHQKRAESKVDTIGLREPNFEYTIDDRDASNKRDLKDDSIQDEDEGKNEENFGSPIASVNIPEEVEDPELASLFKNLKEKQNVYNSLKTKIMNELDNLQVNQGEYEEIEEYFKTRAVQAGQAQEMIKSEINEVKERLEIIQVIKKREKLMSLKNKRKWIAALQKLEGKTDSLKENQKDLDQKLQRIQQDAEDLHSLEMKKFKDVLKHTETALSKVEREKVKCERRLEECKKALGLATNEHSDQEGGKILKQKMFQETIKRIEVLEIDIMAYEAQNPMMVEKYKSKALLEKELADIKIKIKHMQEDVNGMDEQRVTKQMILDSTQQSLKEQQDRIAQMQKTINNLEMEDEDQIKRIEVYFSRKNREVEMDTPVQILQSSIRKIDGVSLNNEIISKQVEVLAKLKISLLDNVQRTIDVLTKEIAEKVIEVKHIGDTLKTQSKGLNKHDEDAVKLNTALKNKFKLLCGEFHDLKVKKLKSELRLKHRDMVLTSFIVQQSQDQPDVHETIHYKQKQLVADEEVVSYVIQEKSLKPGVAASGDDLEAVITEYHDLVRRRELQIQNCIESISGCKFIINQNLETMNDAKDYTDEMYYFRKSELTDLKVAASKIEKQLDLTKADIEIEILDMGNKKFSTYYKKNLADKARKMEKVYGPKAVNQFKGKNKRDITDATYMNNHRAIQNYQAALDLLEESKKQIPQLQQELSQNDSNNKEGSTKNLEVQKEKLKNAEEQYEAIIDAEKQLSQHIQDSIRSKVEDIDEKTSQLYVKHQYSRLEQELVTTKKTIADAEGDLQDKLNQTIVSDIESQSEYDENLMTQEGINKELLDEDKKLKQKFDELKDDHKMLKKEVNPQLKEMEYEHEQIEQDIKNSKVTLESLYGKYSEIKKVIELCKESILNKYPDEAPDLSSYAETNDKDEIDQEIELMRNNKKSVIQDDSKSVKRSTHQLNLSNSRSYRATAMERIKEKLDRQQDKKNCLNQNIFQKVMVSQLTESIEISLNETHTCYQVEFSEASPFEIEFFEKIHCLLEGRRLFVPMKLENDGNNETRPRVVLMTDDLHHLLVLNHSQFGKLTKNSEDIYNKSLDANQVS